MICIFTDGSLKTFKKGNEKKYVIGWGYVVVRDNKEYHSACGKFSEPLEFTKQRNIAGEIAAVISGLQWAEERNIDKVLIVCDYNGCKHWPDGNWEAKNLYTQIYRDTVNAIRENMKVRFKHVKGHGKNDNEFYNRWNDVADVLAKKGITLD